MNLTPQSFVLLCGVAVAGASWSGTDDPDAELIEFLGSWVSEMEDWEEFFDSIPQELAEGEAKREKDGRSEERDSD